MPDLVEAIRRAVGDSICTGARAADWVAELYASLGLPVDAIQDAIDRARVLSCGESPDNLGPVGEPPSFSGGQCLGVSYRITVDYEVQLQDGGVASQVTPLVFVRAGSLLSYRLEGTGNLGREGGAGIFIVFKNNDGDTEPKEFGKRRSERVVGVNVLDVRVSRTDGLPDDCGDPPRSAPEPREEHDDTIDIDYEDENGNPISLPDIPIKFFKPCVDVFDGIRVPFEVDLGFTKVCGKVGLGWDLKTIVEPTIDIDVCPEQRQGLTGPQEEQMSDFFDVGSVVGVDVNTGGTVGAGLAGGGDPEPNELERPIVGVIVSTRREEGIGSATVILQSDPTIPFPNVPRIATVTFGALIQESENTWTEAWTDPQDVKYTRELIACPVPWGAMRVRIYWQPGFVGGYRPLYRKTCCAKCEGNDPNDALDTLDRCRVD